MLKQILNIVLISWVTLITVFAQETTQYSSWYGSFTIEIPAGIRETGGGPLNVVEMGGTGDSYGRRWAGGGVWLEAMYISYEKSKTGVATQRVANAISALKSNHADDGNTLIAARKILTNGFKGHEIEFEFSMGRILYRFYINGNRAVRLMATYKLGPGRDTAIGFLDSIRLYSQNEIETLKIKEAAPGPLPQTPPADRAKPEEDLKGPVAKVITERQGMKNGVLASSRLKLNEVQYDRQGYLLRSVQYSYDGHPDKVVLYGYIDGMRVSDSGYVKNERQFTGMIPPKPGEIPKKRDLRYDNRYEIKYDESGRVKERITYQNNGDVWRRLVYTYATERVESIEYNNEGEQVSRNTETLDAKGNVISSLNERLGEYPSTYRSTYKYEMFDKMGNWIKRTELTELLEKDHVKSSWQEVEYRKITYWR